MDRVERVGSAGALSVAFLRNAGFALTIRQLALTARRGLHTRRSVYLRHLITSLSWLGNDYP